MARNPGIFLWLGVVFFQDDPFADRFSKSFRIFFGRSAIGFKIYEMQCRLPKWQVPAEMDFVLVVLGRDTRRSRMDGWMVVFEAGFEVRMFMVA